MNAGHCEGSEHRTEAFIADEWALLLLQSGDPAFRQAARCESCGDR